MSWEFDNSKPIYIQLVDTLKMKIVSGEFQPGSKMLTVRALAAEAEVNPNTMQRALSELEREELMYSQRTKGRFVTDDIDKINKMKKDMANERIDGLKEFLVQLGYSPDEIISLIAENVKGEYLWKIL